MELESPTPLDQEQAVILELLPHMLQDSGYVIEFDDGPTSVYYMNPEVYLKLLRGPTWQERLYYKWMTVKDIIWKVCHPWSEER